MMKHGRLAALVRGAALAAALTSHAWGVAVGREPDSAWSVRRLPPVEPAPFDEVGTLRARIQQLENELARARRDETAFDSNVQPASLTQLSQCVSDANPPAAQPAWVDLWGQPWWIDEAGYDYYDVDRDTGIQRIYRTPLRRAIAMWLHRQRVRRQVQQIDLQAAVREGVREAVIEGFNAAAESPPAADADHIRR